MHSTKIQPTNQDRRSFGLIIATVIGGFAGYHYGLSIPQPFIICLVLWTVISLTIPIVLHPLYVVWMAVGSAMGWINTRLILSILFICVLTPIGVIMRLLGHRGLEPDTISEDSYFVRAELRDNDHFNHPY